LRPLRQEGSEGKAAWQEHPLAGCNCQVNKAIGLLLPQPFGL